MFMIIIFQSENDKDDSKIEKLGKKTEVYPWQIFKTENEGKTIELCCKSIF